MSKSIVLAIFICSEILLIHAVKDYCWRDYDGTIPEDAVHAGRNKEGKDIYIGQAYVKNEGLVVVQIDPGKKTVYAEMEGIKQLDKNIKILCGPSENFYWLETDLHKLEQDSKKHQLVVGGHEDDWGGYFVGRIKCEDELCIGKVLEKGWNGQNIFLAADKNGHKLKAESYEVLVNEPIIDARIA